MKTISTAFLAWFLCACVAFVGCKTDQSATKQGEAAISGFIKDSGTKIGLGGATISVSSLTSSQQAVSNLDGSFPNITFATDSILIVSVLVQKSGYNDTTFSVALQSGTVSQITVLLTPRSVIVPPGGGTGLAQTIAFLGSNPDEISVYGVGSQETSILGWEVRDSLGLPIDATHSVVLTFTLVSGPNGGEYVSPPQVTTNGIGRAYTTFNAGIRAGVTQVLATALVGARTIQSQPVRVIMDGGFPVQSHFSVSPGNYNFAALDWQNRRDRVAVLVGDIYSNPVAKNTGVYFHTSPYPVGEYGGAGVIQPAVYTDVDGLGGVDLISGFPLPMGVYADPTAGFGNGYHWVVARTIGQGGVIVQDSIRLLWSGQPFITNVNPGAFAIPNSGHQDFTFTVSDELGHPLSAGTSITVTAQVPPPPDPNTAVNQVQVGFGLNGTYVLKDVILPGPNTTDFSFRLSDGTTNVTQATAVTMTISVSGPNGTAIFFINGTVN